jgi:hypothetical protein
MLTADVRVEGFDVPDWMALRDIFSGASAASGHTGGLVAWTQGERITKLVSTARGRLDPSGLPASAPLGALAEGYGARWAVRLDRGAAAELSDRFARSLESTDDLLGQALKLAKAVRELAEEGVLETYPRDARTLAFPSERIVLRALDVVCPVGKTVLLAAFDGAEVLTSLALHRGEHGIDRIVGPALVRREMGLVSGDWARDSRGLSRAVSLGVGPLSLGCFGQAETFRRLLRDTTPGAWATAVAARDVLFTPVTPALAIPLGLDVGRAAVVVARDLAARFGLSSWLAADGPLRPALERVREVAGSAELASALGFDPVALLRELFGARHPER